MKKLLFSLPLFLLTANGLPVNAFQGARVAFEQKQQVEHVMDGAAGPSAPLVVAQADEPFRRPLPSLNLSPRSSYGEAPSVGTGQDNSQNKTDKTGAVLGGLGILGFFGGMFSMVLLGNGMYGAIAGLGLMLGGIGLTQTDRTWQKVAGAGLLILGLGGVLLSPLVLGYASAASKPFFMFLGGLFVVGGGITAATSGLSK